MFALFSILRIEIKSIRSHESARRAHPSQNDRDEAAYRCLGRQVAGCGEAVEVVARSQVQLLATYLHLFNI
jgi:hypothetical protein